MSARPDDASLPARLLPGAARLFPGAARLRRYQRSWLRGDLVSGVTVAGYLIPQVMAYAQVAGLRPVAGLWAIIGSLAVYALVGSSPQLSVGPESTTALLTGTAIAPLAMGDPGRAATLAATLALLVGGVCVLAWVLRLGFLADLLSRPVLVGYMAGVALIMMIGQLGKVTGVRAEGGGSPLAELWSMLPHLSQLKGPTVLLAAGVLVLLLAGTRWLPKAPVPLIVILLAAGLVAALRLQEHGVAVVGPVPGGVPVPAWPGPSSDDLIALLLPALGLTVVGYTDNVLTGRAFG